MFDSSVTDQQLSEFNDNFMPIYKFVTSKERENSDFYLTELANINTPKDKTVKGILIKDINYLKL